MLVLGLESSCDETAASVVEDGRRVLSNHIASQVEMHQRYGGVVPEIASRAHLEAIVPVVEGALAEAGVGMDAIDAIAVTRGPGLIGCLLVGVEFAKTLATVHGLPLVAVHHVAGHLYSPFLGREADAWGAPMAQPAAPFEPYIAMALSGGHSSMVLAEGPLQFRTLGETLDDAVGEAYDKIAKLIGLGYPGGPVVDRLAATGNPVAYDLPRPLLHRPDYDFSFSGLKTAFARQVEKLGGAPAIAADQAMVADLCASFQAACVDLVLAKARRALRDHGLRRLALTGGVACNRGLRARAGELRGIHVAIPAPEYCTDNAAMIAGAGYHALAQPTRSTPALNATPQIDIAAGPAAWQG